MKANLVTNIFYTSVFFLEKSLNKNIKNEHEYKLELGRIVDGPSMDKELI